MFAGGCKKQFSLRSLLLAVSSIASLLLVIKNWQPWQLKLILPSGNDAKTAKGDGYQSLVTFSPDGSRICYCGDSTFPRVCDAATGREMFMLSGAIKDVVSVNYSPNGRWIVSAGADGIARIWDAQTGNEIKQLPGHKGALKGASFSHNSKMIITSGSDSSARIWNVSNGTEIANLSEESSDEKEAGPVHCSGFVPGDKLVVTVSGNGIRYWDTATWTQTAAFSDVATVFSIAFSPDGSKLLTGNWDSVARVRSIPGGTLKNTISPATKKHIHAAIYFNRGEIIMTASCDNTISIWDTATLTHLTDLISQPDLISAAVSPDSHTIGSASRDGRVWLWYRRRPEQWWGIAWLYELWINLAFSCGLVWSVKADRRRTLDFAST